MPWSCGPCAGTMPDAQGHSPKTHWKVSRLRLRWPALHLIRLYQAANLASDRKPLPANSSFAVAEIAAADGLEAEPEGHRTFHQSGPTDRPAKASRCGRVGKLLHQAACFSGTHRFVERGSLPGEGQFEASASPRGPVHFRLWAGRCSGLAGSEVMSLQPPPGWMARCILLGVYMGLWYPFAFGARPCWVSRPQ